MNALDLHPEDLIDKLVAGDLSDAESERLRAHLSVCSVCRLEIALRDDLSAESPEAFGARPALRAPEPDHAALPPASLRPRAPLRRPLLLLAAAAILGTGGALAAVLTGVVHRPWAPAPAVSDGPAPSIAPRAARTKLAVAAQPPSTPVAPSESLPAPEEAPSFAAGTALPGETSVAKKSRAAGADGATAPHRLAKAAVGADVYQPARPVSTADLPPSSDIRAQDAPAPSASPRPESRAASSAASLFAAANRARRDGNIASAAELYRALERQYPRLAESQLSRSLLAKLELDNGDAEGALAGFDRYLSEGAPVLTAESLVGRARALEQLGKRDEAAASWREVLRRFPGSVHARLASTRLSALGMR